MDDVALVEHRDSIRQSEGLFLVVGDENEGDAEPALDIFQFNLHLLAEFEVECSEWLVEQKHFGFYDKRAGQGNALALTSRKLSWRAIAVAFEANKCECVAGGCRAFLCANSADPQAVGNVVEHGHVRKKGVILKHRVDVAVEGRIGGDIFSEQLDSAARGLLESGNHAQDRRLARPGWAQHGEEFSGCNVEVNSVNCGH